MKQNWIQVFGPAVLTAGVMVALWTFSGLWGMAGRLTAIETAVGDLRNDVHQLEERIDAVNIRIDNILLQNSAAGGEQ